MIVNNTALVTLTEDRETAFAVVSRSLSVVNPLGGLDPASPPITVVPEILGTEQVFTAAYLPTFGGNYTFNWTYNDGTHDIVRVQNYWSYWTDAPLLTRNELSITSRRLPDSRYDAEFARLTRSVIARYPCIASYASLQGDDKAYFDEAIAFMAAVTLFSAKSGNTTGQTQQIQAGTFKFVYGTNSDDRKRFADQAFASLNNVSCIAKTRAADTWSPNRISGPSSQARKSGVQLGVRDQLIDLLQDPLGGSLL